MANDKVLIIRKPDDRLLHQAPIGNKAALMSFNNRLPEKEKWSFEEMSKEEAANLPAIDPNYVSAGEAFTKLKKTEGVISEQAARIAELEFLLKSRAESPIGASVGVSEPRTGAVTPETVEESKPETAPEVIAKIKAANSADEVKQILGKDTRKTVQDAAAAMIESFK